MAKDYDKFLMPELPMRTPICHSCVHWNGDLTCKAFPKGIPVGIFTGALDHTQPIGRDHGIQYERKPG